MTLTIGGCGAVPLPSPRDRWLSGPERSPHIFSTWTGVTAKRIVYDYDGNPHEVAVLEGVRGPDPAGALKKDGNVALDVPWPLPEYFLSNANNLLLEAAQVPPGSKVRVEGFVRIWKESGSVYNSKAGFNQIADATWPKSEKLDTFSLIKARRIVAVQPGDDCLLWESDVRFWHL